MAFISNILVSCGEPSNSKEASSNSADKKVSSSQTTSSSTSSEAVTSSYNVSSSQTKETSSKPKIPNSKTSNKKLKNQNTKSKASSTKPTLPSKPQGPQPLIFDDPIAEKLIRNMAKKENGNVYPSDLEYLKSQQDLQFSCSYATNTSQWSDSACERGIATQGVFKSLKAIENIPFNGIRFCYSQQDGVQQACDMDMNWFTKTGFTEFIYIQGYYNMDSKTVAKVNIKNFNSISNCKNLKSLRLQYCSGVDLSALSKLNSLETLEVTDCNINSFSAIKNLQKLNSLTINTNQTNDLSSVVLTLPNLKYLNLTKCEINNDTYTKLTQKGVIVRI